jgi:hypothetical protein
MNKLLRYRWFDYQHLYVPGAVVFRVYGPKPKYGIIKERIIRDGFEDLIVEYTDGKIQKKEIFGFVVVDCMMDLLEKEKKAYHKIKTDVLSKKGCI